MLFKGKLKGKANYTVQPQYQTAKKNPINKYNKSQLPL